MQFCAAAFSKGKRTKATLLEEGYRVSPRHKSYVSISALLSYAWNKWSIADVSGQLERMHGCSAFWLSPAPLSFHFQDFDTCASGLQTVPSYHSPPLLVHTESTQRPAWDGTPAPLPAPRNVRRAISSLLMPDPDERLRDKLIKSRKAAAGIPVTASSTKDEVRPGRF